MIRLANLADLDSLVILERDSFPDENFSRRRMRYLMLRAKSVALVHEEKGIHGYALLLFRNDTDAARLYSVCVDGSHRNKGVGKGLVDSAEQTAKRMGRKRMTLEVKEDCKVTVQFYCKLGYVPVGRLKNYYGKGVHGLRMMKHF